jgi:hypothetical protein
MIKSAVAFSTSAGEGEANMMSKCWKTGDSEGDVLAKLKAAQAELLLIIEADDVNASDIVDLRSVIARLEEAILTLQLKR